MANPKPSDAQLADKNSRAMIGTQQAKVANAQTNHTINATFSNTEVKAALDALGTKINSLLAIVEAHGLMSDT